MNVLEISLMKLAYMSPEPEMDAGDYYAECMANEGRIRDVNPELLEAVGYVDGAVAQKTITALRGELKGLSGDLLGFLGGLKGRLSSKECELFWELLGFEEAESGERLFRSYAEVGQSLGGITKQAVEKRLRTLDRKFPGIGSLIKDCRCKTLPKVFSALSPTQRRSSGVDEAFSSDAENVGG